MGANDRQGAAWAAHGYPRRALPWGRGVRDGPGGRSAPAPSHL